MLRNTDRGNLDRVRFCAPSGGEQVFSSAGECAGLTHNRKLADGGNGVESTIVSAFPEQKCPQGTEWRRFEGGVSVGKDEITGSYWNNCPI